MKGNALSTLWSNTWKPAQLVNELLDYAVIHLLLTLELLCSENLAQHELTGWCCISLGAVGLTMLITTLGIEVALLVEPIFAATTAGATEVNLEALLNADLAVAAFLISFGGLIGKIGATQISLLVILEAVFLFGQQAVVAYEMARNR